MSTWCFAAVVFVGLLTWVLSGAIVVVVLYTPTYLQKVHHIPAALALEANALATFMLTLGCVTVGWWSDRIGKTWLRIRMLRTEMDSEGTPLCWNDAYLEPSIGKRVAPLVPNGTGLLSQIIEQTVGVTVADIKRTIGATTIGDMARRLLVEPGVAGLEITRTYLDDARQPFLITVNTYPADKLRFTFWMHRTPTSA